MKLIGMLLICLIAHTSRAQVGQILPENESKSDPELMQFVHLLEKAVIDRDTTFIRNNLAETCYLPVEGGESCTPEAFYTFYFDPEEPNYENIWENFERVFAIGGGRIVTEKQRDRLQRFYYMPYTSAKLMEDRLELMEVGSYSVSLNKNLPVYAQPTKQSKIVTYLDYEIVRTYDDTESKEEFEEDPRNDQDFIPDVYPVTQENWTPVYLDEQKGYVETKYIAPLFDVQCALVKQAKGWKIQLIGYFD